MCSQDFPCYVLFVEDEPFIVTVVQAQAKRYKNLGIEFVFASSIEEAEQKIEENDFTICIADLGLGDSRGIETFDNIKRLTKNSDPPIYIHTGDYDEDLRNLLIEHGAREVFCKNDISLFNLVVFAHHAANEQRNATNLEQAAERLREERNLWKNTANELQRECEDLQAELGFIKAEVKGQTSKQIFTSFEQRLNELRDGVKRLAATQ